MEGKGYAEVVGIDLGFGFCKVYSDNGRHIFPSIAGPCNEEVLRVSGVRNPAYEHETVFLDNKKFLVGNSAARYSERVYQARDKDWIDSFTYRCLLHHALRLAGVNNSSLTPQETVIVTGLPVTHYRSCRPKLIDLVKSMTHPDVSVKVTLQPLGSYFDHLLCDDGGIQDMELVHNRVGVIDIGFYTSDFITVESLELVKNLLETREGGMSSVYQEIARDNIQQPRHQKGDLRSRARSRRRLRKGVRREEEYRRHRAAEVREVRQRDRINGKDIVERRGRYRPNPCNRRGKRRLEGLS